MIDAQWIFEHHRLILAQEKFLQAQIIHLTYPNGQHDAEEILSRVLTRPALGTPHQTLFQESSTERVALQMQGKENDQSNITMNECLEKLSCCQQLLEIYDTIISAITPNEAWLVDAFYTRRLTSTAIQNMPDCPFGPCDRSTLYRKRKRIVHKANALIQSLMPKEGNACRLEKYVNELKQLPDKSTMI